MRLEGHSAAEIANALNISVSRVAQLVYQAKIFKVTRGNCYEIYGLDKAGKRVLVLEAALNDGYHYYLEMTPIR
jgi:hypothetical protein